MPAIQQIDALIKDNRWDEARKALRALLRQDQRSTAGWWRYAQVAPDLNEACTALQNILVLEPDNAQAKAALAVLKRRLSEQAQAPAAGDASEAAEALDAKRARQERIEMLAGVAMIAVALVLVVGFLVVNIGSSGGLFNAGNKPIYKPISMAKTRPMVAQLYAEW